MSAIQYIYKWPYGWAVKNRRNIPTNLCGWYKCSRGINRKTKKNHLNMWRMGEWERNEDKLKQIENNNKKKNYAKG